MEVKVIIGFDSKAESLLENMIGVFGNTIDAKIDVSDSEIAETVNGESKTPIEEETKPSEVIDYATLKKEAKALGIKLIQMKKKKEVQELTSKFGYEKISDVEDKDIAAYLAELKSIMEGK